MPHRDQNNGPVKSGSSVPLQCSEHEGQHEEHPGQVRMPQRTQPFTRATSNTVLQPHKLHYEFKFTIMEDQSAPPARPAVPEPVLSLNSSVSSRVRDTLKIE